MEIVGCCRLDCIDEHELLMWPEVRLEPLDTDSPPFVITPDMPHCLNCLRKRESKTDLGIVAGQMAIATDQLTNEEVVVKVNWIDGRPPQLLRRSEVPEEKL